MWAALLCTVIWDSDFFHFVVAPISRWRSMDDQVNMIKGEWIRDVFPLPRFLYSQVTIIPFLLHGNESLVWSTLKGREIELYLWGGCISIYYLSGVSPFIIPSVRKIPPLIPLI